jgi:hypothetical protein
MEAQRTHWVRWPIGILTHLTIEARGSAKFPEFLVNTVLAPERLKLNHADVSRNS